MDVAPFPATDLIVSRMHRIDELARETGSQWFLYQDIAAINEQVDGNVEQLILELQDRAELLLLWAAHEDQNERFDTATRFHHSAQAYASAAACLIEVR